MLNKIGHHHMDCLNVSAKYELVSGQSESAITGISFFTHLSIDLHTYVNAPKSRE